MEMLSGAEMVVRSLIDQGVKQVFGYPEARSSIFMTHYIPLAVSITSWCVMSKLPCIWLMDWHARQVRWGSCW